MTLKRLGTSAATMTPRVYDDVTLEYKMTSRVDTVDHSCPTVVLGPRTAGWIIWASMAVTGLEGFSTTPSEREHLGRKRQ